MIEAAAGAAGTAAGPLAPLPGPDDPRRHPERQRRATELLEQGKVLYFPDLGFALRPEERALLQLDWRGLSSKNITVEPGRGVSSKSAVARQHDAVISAMMARYGAFARGLVEAAAPGYGPALVLSRATFRPVEAEGRARSPREDDQRLHPDAFLSRPTGGRRILRVFTNISEAGQPRVWRVGEPFDSFARQFVPRARPPLPGAAHLLRAIGRTAGRRSLYDHYMLSLHDLAKADDDYQKRASSAEVAFPAGSSWLLFSDVVLHAVVSGRALLEQTFLLPVAAQSRPETSPLRILEALTGRALAAG